MSEIYIVATAGGQPEKADNLRDMLKDAVAQFWAEDGCLGYDVPEKTEQPVCFMTDER